MPTNDPTPSPTATATLLTALPTLLLPLNALQMIKLLLLRLLLLYSTYSPINSAASPECLTNDQIPSPTTTATLLTVLLTLLFPWMPYKWSNSFSCDYCYSTYSPTNSAASPECLTNYPIPSFTALATLLTALPTLLLPLNAFTNDIKFLLLRLLLLYLQSY